jgi:hypothetical protein
MQKRPFFASAKTVEIIHNYLAKLEPTDMLLGITLLIILMVGKQKTKPTLKMLLNAIVFFNQSCLDRLMEKYRGLKQVI